MERDRAVLALKSAVRHTLLVWDATHDLETALDAKEVGEEERYDLLAFIEQVAVGFDTSEQVTTEAMSNALDNYLTYLGAISAGMAAGDEEKGDDDGEPN